MDAGSIWRAMMPYSQSLLRFVGDEFRSDRQPASSNEGGNHDSQPVRGAGRLRNNASRQAVTSDNPHT